MRFSFAIVLAVAGAAIEARPNSESTEADKIDTSVDSNLEARGLISNLLGGLGQQRSSSSATSASSSSTSSSTSLSSTTSIPASTSTSIPASKATNEAPAGAKVKTYGNDVITEINSAGTTGDRRGFKWTPVDTSE